MSFTNDARLALNNAAVMNTGTILLESVPLAQDPGDPYGAGLHIDGTVTLQGAGKLVLSGDTAPLFWVDGSPTQRSRSFIGLRNGASSALLVNRDGHRIEGTGQIGFFEIEVQNLAGGVIDANVAGAGLVIASERLGGELGMTNLGTMQASNGGELRHRGGRDEPGWGGVPGPV